MFGGKKEKALQDELYTIKKQIAEYSDELKEDSVQMTASRVQMEENIEILEEKLECVGELAEESCRTGKELYSTFVEVHNAVESFEANHSIFIGQVAEQNEKIKEVFEQHKALKEPCAQLEESLYRASKEQDGLGNVTAELEDDAKNMGVLALNAANRSSKNGREWRKNSFMLRRRSKNVAQRYEERLKALSEQIDAMEEAQKEIKEQTAQINEMQAGITSMVMKLYSDSAQKLSIYENGQTSLREHMSGNAVPAADFIKQAGEDFLKLGDEAKVQVTALREEINAKKSAEDELEKIYNGCKALLDME